MSDDIVSIHHLQGRYPMALLTADRCEHVFPRHYHETYLIEVVTQGVDAFLCGRRTWRAEVGSVLFVHPGEVHTGQSVGSEPLAYRAFYPSEAVFREICEQSGAPPRPPCFPKTVVYDPALARQLIKAHQLACESSSPEADNVLGNALAASVRRHGESSSMQRASVNPAVRMVQQALESDPARNWTLEELGYQCGYSPFHLVRLFRNEVGMPPHEYLQAVRAERARLLLQEGRKSWEAAAILGYADQAHFTRSFRKINATTPGAFRPALAQDGNTQS